MAFGCCPNGFYIVCEWFLHCFAIVFGWLLHLIGVDLEWFSDAVLEIKQIYRKSNEILKPFQQIKTKRNKSKQFDANHRKANQSKPKPGEAK